VNVPAFEYLRATSLKDACALLSARGQQGKVIAGGTDLLVKMKHRRLVPPYLIDIKGIAGLDHLGYAEREGLRIGALATIESLKRSTPVRKQYPMLHQAAAYMATVAIRNRATVVGYGAHRGAGRRAIGPGRGLLHRSRAYRLGA
jgi:CO/xanthine dehydrogenase FAD-binding subunit